MIYEIYYKHPIEMIIIDMFITKDTVFSSYLADFGYDHKSNNIIRFDTDFKLNNDNYNFVNKLVKKFLRKQKLKIILNDI